jgi:hypothetical protein
VRVEAASWAGTTGGNEDFVAGGRTVALVLDGVSAWFSAESGCRHGTAWFVRQLGERLLAAAVTGPLPDAVARAIAEVAGAHDGSCDLSHPWGPAATLALVREHAVRWEYLVLADATLVVEQPGGYQVVVDRRLAELDAAASAPGAGETLRRHQREGFAGLRNTAGGYWVAASDPAAAAHAVTGALPRTGRVALLTDGASALVDVFGQSWGDLFGLLDRAGPPAVLRAVRDFEEADPTATRWPRPKPHDDATVAVCTGE